MKLKDLLPDILEVTSRFRNVITHIILTDRGDNVKILAKSTDGSMAISGVTKGPVDDLNNIACLGSLDFLSASLSAPAMKKGTLDLHIDSSADGKAQVVRSITMTGENGYSVFYQAVDPFISKLNKIAVNKIKDWPVLFAIDKTYIERFTDTMKVHAKAPKIGTDEDDIYTLTYSDGQITVEFGERGHQVSMMLTGETETTGTTEKVNALFSISQTDAILKLVGKEGAVGYLVDKAMKVDIHTKHAEYEFVSTAKLKRK